MPSLSTNPNLGRTTVEALDAGQYAVRQGNNVVFLDADEARRLRDIISTSHDDDTRAVSPAKARILRYPCTSTKTTSAKNTSTLTRYRPQTTSSPDAK